MSTAGVALGHELAQQERMLPLCELFTTVQGEGPHTGRAATFVRVGGCNLACTWCDSAYTWDDQRYDVAAECPQADAEVIARRVLLTRAPLVVLTGGEPLIHQRRPALHTLLARLVAAGRQVHVETNGTIPPTREIRDRVDFFVVSPKLAHAGDPARRRVRPRALAAFTDLAARRRACFKFVATAPGDLVEVDTITRDHDIPPDAVWIMPEGTTAETVLARHRALVDAVLDRGWNTSSRLHTLLWGQERGR